MKNKLHAVFCAVIAVCSVAVLLTACGDKNDNAPSTTVSAQSVESAANEQSTKEQTLPFTKAEILSQNEYYTYYKPATQKNTIAYSYVQHTIKSDQTQPSNQSNNSSQNNSASYEEIPEIENGISIVTKTSPVIIGNSATVMIKGTPGKKYSLDFYETASKAANCDGLENKTADSSGFVTWSFEIKGSCMKGNRKIVIKELGSDKYIQTSITVQ